MTPDNVVAIAGGPVSHEQLLILKEGLAPGSVLSLIGFGDLLPTAAGEVGDFYVVALGSLTRSVRFGVLGILALRIWPGSPARQLWRRIRHDQSALAAAEAADLIVALDARSVLAAWHLSQRNSAPAIVQGIAPALRKLAG